MGLLNFMGVFKNYGRVMPTKVQMGALVKGVQAIPH